MLHINQKNSLLSNFPYIINGMVCNGFDGSSSFELLTVTNSIKDYINFIYFPNTRTQFRLVLITHSLTL